MFTSENFSLFRGIVFKFQFHLTAVANNPFEICRNVSYCCPRKYETWRNTAASIIGNGVISLLRQIRCHWNPDRNKFSSVSNTAVVVIFHAQTWKV